MSSCGVNVPILALYGHEVSLCPHRSLRGSSPAGDALAAWHKGSDADAPQRPHPTAQSPSRVRTCPSAPGFGAAVEELLQKVTASPGSCLWCEEGGERPHCHPHVPPPCVTQHPPALRDISASLRGRSEGLTPAGEPRMSGRALRRPVLPEDAKSSTGSTSVMLTLMRYGPFPITVPTE